MAIEILSDDLLLHVFSFLDAISLCKVKRVSWRWHDLSQDDILWKYKLMNDIKSWRRISSNTIPESPSSSSTENSMDLSPIELYLNGCPDIQKWKRLSYQQTTLHQLTDFLRNLLPLKNYMFGVGASATDSYGKGQSFFSKLLSFDRSNVFQHCGQFPGSFRGVGGGFKFKYKKQILELCLMYVAPKSIRDTLSLDEKMNQLETQMNDLGYSQLLASLGGYIHTIDTRIVDNATEDSVIAKIDKESREVLLLDQKLAPEIPLLVLSFRKLEADLAVPSYHVAKALRLKTLKRPWMVADCSAQMIYRDVVDPIDWLIANAKSH